jgi:molybdenum cofactor cytidylyltransferase
MYNHQMSLTLAQALRTGSQSRIAFAGAGGKTTAMFQLAREMLKAGEIATVMVTATTHLGIWQTSLADIHIISDPLDPSLKEHQLQGVTLITGRIDGDRTRPLNEHTMNWLHQYCDEHSIPLLIEADGSRQKPLKAWLEHEPPIPSFVDHVVQVVGLSGLGKSLTEEHIHRSEVFSKLSRLEMGEPVTTNALIQILKHTGGGLKNNPFGARKTALLNQADTVELQATALGLVKPLMTSYDSVVISSLRQEMVFAAHESVVGVVLAAGESARYGQTKQLLKWKGRTFVQAVTSTALQAGLSPVLVVTGANAEPVELAVKDLDVEIVRNDDWKSGQGSSIRAAVKSFMSTRDRSFRDKEVGGAIFLLADQPQVTTSVLHALVQRHSESLHPIIAPMVMDRRANPVLFDRAVFSDLMRLEGDVGGRAIFHKHPVEYLPWHDDRLLLDVDTPEMYQRMISDESL